MITLLAHAEATKPSTGLAHGIEHVQFYLPLLTLAVLGMLYGIVWLLSKPDKVKDESEE